MFFHTMSFEKLEKIDFKLFLVMIFLRNHHEKRVCTYSSLNRADYFISLTFDN
jgi:hypothetical protein